MSWLAKLVRSIRISIANRVLVNDLQRNSLDTVAEVLVRSASWFLSAERDVGADLAKVLTGELHLSAVEGEAIYLCLEEVLLRARAEHEAMMAKARTNALLNSVEIDRLAVFGERLDLSLRLVMAKVSLFFHERAARQLICVGKILRQAQNLERPAQLLRLEEMSVGRQQSEVWYELVCNSGRLFALTFESEHGEVDRIAG